VVGGQLKTAAGSFLALVLLSTASGRVPTSDPGPTAGKQTNRSDCSEPPSRQESPGNQGISLQTKPVVTPGEEITLTIVSGEPLDITRGVASYLECWNGHEWATKYTLLTRFSDQSPTLAGPDQPVPAIALLGPGPEPIRMPGKLLPGSYRIRKQIFARDRLKDGSLTIYAYVQVKV
jgi:hypothetical protein